MINLILSFLIGISQAQSISLPCPIINSNRCISQINAGSGITFMILNQVLTISTNGIVGTFTPGSVLFAAADGSVTQDNANFFWDDTSHRLGLIQDFPSSTLHLGNGNTTTNSYEAGLYFSSGDAMGNARDWQIFNAGPGSGFPVGTLLIEDMGFDNLNNGSGFPTMAFSGSNVGIGTTTPAGLLDIESSSPGQVFIDSAAVGTKVSIGTTETGSELTVANHIHIANNASANGIYWDDGGGPGSDDDSSSNLNINGGFNINGGGNSNINFKSQGTTIATINPSGGGYFGIGPSLSPAAVMHIAGQANDSAWGLNGIQLRVDGGPFTDASSSGTVADTAINAIQTPTITAENAATYTNISTLYIQGAPVAGTNATITNSFALSVASGNSSFGGNVNVSGLLQLAVQGTGVTPTCGATQKGTLALTHLYVLCVCNTSIFVKVSDGSTSCTF